MKKIKVAYLVSTLNTGGAERQLINTLNGIDLNRFDVKVFVLKKQIKLKGALKSCIPVEVIDVNAYANLRHILKVCQSIHKFSPDILHSVMYASNLLARFYKLKYGNTIVINHIHGLGTWIKWYHILLDRCFLRWVDRILVVSERSLKLRLQRENYPNEKLTLLYNSINCESFEFRDRKAPDKKYILGTASRLVELKQIDLAIKIIKQLNDLGVKAKLLIAGDGPELNNLHALVRTLELENKVIFEGQVDNMAEFYKKINCFILCSRTEDMPLSIIEAFASGLPVIAPSIGGIPEIVSQERGLLLDSFKNTDSVSKIKSFLSELNFNKMHKNNAAYACSNFDNKSQVEKLEQLYLSVVK